MSYTRNVSPVIATVIATLLINQGVAHTITPVDGPSAKRQMDISVAPTPEASAALDAAYKRAIAVSVEIETGIDSSEQSSSRMNGTLFNLAPGLAATLQIYPFEPHKSLSEQEASILLNALLLPLVAQGWVCDVAIGTDLDCPA